MSGAALPLPDPPLADAACALRPWRGGDAASVSEGLGVPRAEATAWIERQWRRSGSGEGLSLAICAAAADEAVGYAGLVLRPRVELGTLGSVFLPDPGGELGLVFLPQRAAGIGYWVLERCRRRGLATHAVTLLARWALRAAGLERVEALVEPANVPSQRVVERAGFRHEGRLRCFLNMDGRQSDALVYSLVRADLEPG